jgi:hypothetical protein
MARGSGQFIAMSAFASAGEAAGATATFAALGLDPAYVQP